jgi:regulator of cell morphogenesis and NO signaling
VAEGFDLARLGAPHWALDELADFIVERHHRYVQGAIPALRQALAVAAQRWGAGDEGLGRAAGLFEQLAAELEPHMAKEEHLLFPAIRALVDARRRHQLAAPGPFATLLHPIRAMEGEHTLARMLLSDLRRETHNYAAPSAADEAGRQCYRQLERFHADLEEHIHLEDDVLFPRALELEQYAA